MDDEKTIADLVGIYLQNEGFGVTIAYTGAEAAKAIFEQEFDLAVLDIMLPDIDGFELLRTIRSDRTYPVIMLTARDAQKDKNRGPGPRGGRLRRQPVPDRSSSSRASRRS